MRLSILLRFFALAVRYYIWLCLISLPCVFSFVIDNFESVLSFCLFLFPGLFVVSVVWVGYLVFIFI